VSDGLKPYAACPVKRVPSIDFEISWSSSRAAARPSSPVDSLASPWNRTEGRFMSRSAISRSICCGIPRAIAISNVWGV
jgi:hypothetical protein